MNFIKKIVEKKVDDSVHLQFQKFSKGEFKDRAVIKVKHSAGKYSLFTTAEFANELVKEMADKLGEKTASIKGVIVYTGDLEGVNYKGKKQFMGIKQYVIDSEMSGKEIIELLNKFPKAFFALSFKTGEEELKIKPKAPKSAKPSTKTNEKPNPDFCKLITKNKKIIEDFVFEKSDFKLAEITHHFIIEEIAIPDEIKTEKDFAKIREMSRRKGKIIREAEIDGQKFRKEIELEA